MFATSQRRTEQRSTEQVTAWTGGQQNSKAGNTDGKQLTMAEMMSQMREKLQHDSLEQTSYVEPYGEASFDLSDEDRSLMDLLNRLLEALSGKKLKFHVPKKLLYQPNQGLIGLKPVALTPQTAIRGIGFQITKSEYYSEEESMSFSSVGKVTTSDGRTISFSVDLNLSRSFVSESNLSFSAGALTDPLVINFGQEATALTEQKYSFDLDLDGKNDQISFTKSGSGFLVYDKNGDGIIGNGSEMFGPKTGNGFLELSKYDADGNGWIDENDPIYDKLQIWTKDSKGKDQLIAIGKKGIGAIYLGSVNSTFSLKNDNNDTLGQIRQTGVFLNENGTAGTIQHIDISL
jgi:hypothetical protein